MNFKGTGFMKYEAILFDLDGTLLPMDNDEFTKGYLELLSKAVAPHGYKADVLIPAMWKGVEAMVKNDGSCINSERFWSVFSQIVGKDTSKDIPKFDAFYTDGFNKAIAFTQPTPLAKEAVALAKSKAERVVLATNPFFPPVAVTSRLAWAGIEPEDFDLITHYDNSKFCKPNPAYYIEITDKLGIRPENCLMIGNNTQEDIAAAQAAGLSTFLLTDCLISKDPIPTTPQGSFTDLLEFLK